MSRLEHRPVPAYDFLVRDAPVTNAVTLVCLACSYDDKSVPVHAVPWPCEVARQRAREDESDGDG